MVSYNENLKKFLTAVREGGRAEIIRVLWEATHEVRRHLISEGKFVDVDHILKTACPVLNQASYVSNFHKQMV